jgi:hypothetical protein
VLATALATARPSIVGADSAPDAPSFAVLPPGDTGLAVPLVVGGRVMAVAYAEANDTSNPAWQAAVELLVNHAARCLEALAVRRPGPVRS